jgi:predicted CXXCH cytochrome family protein
MPYRLGLALALAGPEVFLSPLPQSVVQPGSLPVIAKGAGELRLNGKPVTASTPSPGVVHAKVEVGPGRHVLSLGEHRIEFAAGQAQEGWKPFRAHPPAAQCAACHTPQTWEPRGAEACFACHNAEPFAKVHTHNAEVLAECHLCHMPHGSTAKAHLKMAKETACKQCHG